MSRNPATSRRLLGSQLRALRESAGKRIEDAAQHLEYSTATVSRLENGKAKPKKRDVEDLLEFYGETDGDLLERLVELATEAQGQDWLSKFRDVVKGDYFGDHLYRFVELERDASTLQTFEVDLIPGILQDGEYVAAVSRAVFPEATPDAVDRLVDFRLKRQEILRASNPPELSVVISELAVVRPIGGPGVQRRQLESLVSELTGPLKSVDFRILPLVSPEPGALGGPFIIMTFPDTEQNIVYLEGREGATYLESEARVKPYPDKFAAMQGAALDRESSLHRLSTEIDKLGSS